MSEQAMIIDKIGGAGSADAATIGANVERMASDAALWGATVSGPGGVLGRLTDLGLDLVAAFNKDADYAATLGDIEARFTAHAEPLGKTAVALAQGTVDDMRQGLFDGRGAGWVVMAPERYAANLYAHSLEEAGRSAQVFNPSSWVRRDIEGAIDLGRSTRGLVRQFTDLKSDTITVFPGTPGVDEHGRVVPVTQQLRGYSDVTGMLMAHARQAQTGQQVVYRVVKDDVAGILRMAPNLGIEQPAVVPRLSVVEANMLTAGGSGVVHPAVFDILQRSDVEILVCSPKTMAGGGTIIERNRGDIAPGEKIAGIAMQKAVAYTINDIAMEHQAGVAARFADAFADHNLPLINIVTGDGVVRAYVNGSNHENNGSALEHDLEAKYGDTFSLEPGLSIITLVGEAMSNNTMVRAGVEYEARTLGSEAEHVRNSWSSPNGNAVYLTIPQQQAAAYACSAYRYFF